MRSDTVKKGLERAPHRSLFRGTGVIQDESDFQKPFIVGKFVDRDRPTFLQAMRTQMSAKLGDKYIPKEGPSCTS